MPNRIYTRSFSGRPPAPPKVRLAEPSPDLPPSRTSYIGVKTTKHGTFTAVYAGIHRGTFDTAMKAARAHDAAAIEARPDCPDTFLNFPRRGAIEAMETYVADHKLKDEVLRLIASHGRERALRVLALLQGDLEKLAE